MRRLVSNLVFVLVVLSGCSSWRVEQVDPVPYVASARPAFIRLTLSDSSQVILRDPSGVGDSIKGLEVRNLRLAGPGEPLSVAGTEITPGLGVAAAAVAAFFGTIFVIWAVECSSGCD